MPCFTNLDEQGETDVKKHLVLALSLVLGLGSLVVAQNANDDQTNMSNRNMSNGNMSNGNMGRRTRTRTRRGATRGKGRKTGINRSNVNTNANR